MKVIQVPLRMIQPNPEQPRKTFAPEELEELAASIREYGVLQPLLVKRGADRSLILIAGERRFRAAGLAGLVPVGRRFMIIAGERRFRASKIAGKTSIPAVIRHYTSQQIKEISLIENLQRENLNFLEEARAYQKLMTDFHLTQGEIAKKVSKQQSTISNKIRVLSLPEDMQELIIQNHLTERHARALLKLQSETDRRHVLARVVQHHLNVKQTEKLIEDLLLRRESARNGKERMKYLHYKIYVNTLKKAFNQVKTLEKDAKFTQSDMGEFLEVKIIIPKGERCFT